MADRKNPAASFDSLLLLTGRLNYAWTNTESLLIHLIAGLAKTDKDRAVVIFLTLNTTRARVDLVERLAKLDDTPAAQKARVLEFTQAMMKYASLRNRYSHSIYAFDPESGDARTIMMRIADRKDGLKIGRSDKINLAAITDIETAIADLGQLNRKCWTIIRDFNYPA
ncbi:hypothetical protein EOK75_00305 [Pseudorhodobacter turbinis]|uniref:Uncharacterized protein n=1 Tax=Pseudorhodobacter turbinis TaxID=2500533 RepID=A0A4P8EHT1_9RHOB|nr:hypothetical protein [Pseudorhodobacter turbinis]QCO56449.1 hypothetical protein EOK75_00305 [Pseudorhodobacter turbinis]